MAYGYLREERRRVHLPLLVITSSLLLFAAGIGLLVELIRYNRLTVSTRFTVDGLPISGSAAEVTRRLEQPIYLYLWFQRDRIASSGG